MASSFAGFTLFNSGPHRFIIRALGRLTYAPFQFPNQTNVTDDRGRRELAIIQTGRLIAPTNADLWTLISNIQSHAELPRTGALIDHHARSFTNMTLVRFTPDDRIDRARTVSLAYSALYIRFN